MHVQNRRRALLDVLQRDGAVLVRQLAAELSCSEMTVRRDLDALERDGVVRRVHGGAIRVQLRRDEMPYAARALEATEAKQRIGRAVAALIDDGETVILDSGTTTLEVARALRGRPVTVLPLGLRALLELADDDAVSLISPGGDVRPGELVVTGDLAEVAFERLRFDTLVLGCCGLHEREGVTTHVPADARVKRAALRAARRTVLASDATKIGQVTFGHVCSLAQAQRLVTDADPELTSSLEAAGLLVQRA
ncbi:MAG TPA: DeoR/GlpR family DNA-binding transcription regulator [Streptosporangiaceae bacterium]|nr:DeoR/GlpR family DNA-binding transcription regulator [Streptosporangiaceae bacterium]